MNVHMNVYMKGCMNVQLNAHIKNMNNHKIVHLNAQFDVHINYHISDHTIDVDAWFITFFGLLVGQLVDGCVRIKNKAISAFN